MLYLVRQMRSWASDSLEWRDEPLQTVYSFVLQRKEIGRHLSKGASYKIQDWLFIAVFADLLLLTGEEAICGEYGNLTPANLRECLILDLIGSILKRVTKWMCLVHSF